MGRRPTRRAARGGVRPARGGLARWAVARRGPRGGRLARTGSLVGGGGSRPSAAGGAQPPGAARWPGPDRAGAGRRGRTGRRRADRADARAGGPCGGAAGGDQRRAAPHPRGRVHRRRAAVRPSTGAARCPPPRPRHRRGVVHHRRRAAPPVRRAARPAEQRPRGRDLLRGGPRYRGAGRPAVDRDGRPGRRGRAASSVLAGRGGALPPGDAQGARAARARAGDGRPAATARLLPGRRRRGRGHPADGGAGGVSWVGCGVAGVLRAADLRRRPGRARPRVRAVHEPLPRRAARHRRRRGGAPSAGRLRHGPGQVRRAPHRVRGDGRDVPGEDGGARGRQGAGPAARRARPHRQEPQLGTGPGRPGAGEEHAGAQGGTARRGAARAAVRHRRTHRRVPTAPGAAPVRDPAGRHPADRPYATGALGRRLPDEPVRQGRRRGAGAAQARRPGGADAVIDAACHRPRRAHPRDRLRHRRHPGPRRADLRVGALDADHRDLPDRVTGTAGAARPAPARPVRRPHHRDLAVPSRSGEGRHGHAVRQATAWRRAGRLRPSGARAGAA